MSIPFLYLKLNHSLSLKENNFFFYFDKRLTFSRRTINSPSNAFNKYTDIFFSSVAPIVKPNGTKTTLSRF